MVQHKVVHMTTVHHPMDTRIFHKECASLANAAYDVTLIATDHPDLDRVKPAFKLIKLKKAANRWVRMTKNSWQAYRLAKQLEADVYHFHDPELIWVGWLLKNKSNHVVYDIHEDYETGIRQKNICPFGQEIRLRAFIASLRSFALTNSKLCWRKNITGINICAA